MKKAQIITILVIAAVIALAIFIITRTNGSISTKTVLCIANKSTIYVQLGCHACALQEEMFGEDYKYFNVIDCFYEQEKCSNITATPTWLINGKYYVGVQSIEELKDLTNCN